ncbi:YraN family protein [Candidatus Saganbacteria bacterium CG08_land_8_20_14_0_20_45_16]|uniref:UPF0102 protein COT42_03415 n=1 Tax=Candidatus Saganbacteria bacterium CG08_land_8_20_14_0_20_45_16 TaxID=2014293 RepID=A0A2H0XZH2_UNCSA|nr:MAG: YraN family protein [Candidatus Saganbacteria bacterium CG08_land_8_20_14_0_20_45_16]
MGKESYEIGQRGEDLAAEYLANHGYHILSRNFRSQQGEIDLIASDRDFMVFVEVKNYSFRSFGLPSAAIRREKRQSIIHAARTYLYRNRIKNKNCRFDVVAIYRRLDGSRVIELFQNAFFLT